MLVGQNKAKKILSVAFYNHYKRLQLEQDERQVLSCKKATSFFDEFQPAAEETLLAQTLAREFDP